MAVEQVGSGELNGLFWVVDHDQTAGTIGVTVTGTPTTSAKVFLIATVVHEPGGNVLATFGPQEVDQFANLGRQILVTNAALVGVTIAVPHGQARPWHVDISDFLQ